MTRPSRPVALVDTGVVGANLTPAGQALTFTYRPLLTGRRMAISFTTVAEFRFGAEVANWGRQRLQRLDAAIGRAQTIWAGPDLVHRYVTLRAWCIRSGHGLGQKDHEADRWIAATALWLNVPLVAHDGIFFDVDGLELLTRLDRPSTAGRFSGTEPPAWADPSVRTWTWRLRSRSAAFVPAPGGRPSRICGANGTAARPPAGRGLRWRAR